MLKGIERMMWKHRQISGKLRGTVQTGHCYSDGVIQNSEKVNENVMKFARESGVPVLDYQPADTYVDAFNEFYDKSMGV